MKTFFNELKLTFKSIKHSAFIPIITILIFPILCAVIYKNENVDFYFTVMNYMYITIPVSSVMWSIFNIKEYIEGKGNELFFVGHKKIKLSKCIIPFIFYMLITSIEISVISQLDDRLNFEVLKIIVICFMFLCIEYFFAFLTKSTNFTLMILLGYTIISRIIDFNETKLYFLNFYNFEPLTSEYVKTIMLPQLLFSIIILVAGIFLNKKFLKYN